MRAEGSAMVPRGVWTLLLLAVLGAGAATAAPAMLTGPGQDLVVLPPDELRLPFWARGVPDVQVEVYEAPPESYWRWRGWLGDVRSGRRDERPPLELLGTADVAISYDGDEVGTGYADLSPWLGEDRSQVVVFYRQPGADSCLIGRLCGSSWVQSTDTGLSAQLAGDRVVARVTDLVTGAPLAGVDVELLRVGRSVGSATSDGEGVARIDADAGPKSLGGALVAHRRERPVAVLPFDLPPTPPVAGRLQPLLWGEVTPDVARPGDRVVWVGLEREGRSGLRSPSLARGSSGAVWSRLEGGELSTQGPVPLSPSGVATLEVEILEDPARFVVRTYQRRNWPGTRLNSGDQGRVHSANVFIQVPPGPQFVGSEVPITVRPAPEDGAWDSFPVRFSALRAPLRAPPRGWSGWSFGAWHPSWEPWSEISAWTHIEDPLFERRVLPAEGRTDRWTPDAPAWVGPSLVRLQSDNQRLRGAHRDLVVYPGAVLPGLRTERGFVGPDEPIDVLIAAADPSGAPVMGALVEVTLVPAGGGEPVDRCSVRPTANPARCALRPTGGGEWRAVASSTDGRGRTSRSELAVWVEGPGEIDGTAAPLRMTGETVPPERLRLVPEKPTFEPGEIARVLVQTPWKRWSGSATLEGSDAFFTLGSETGSSVLAIPLDAQLLGGRTLEVQVVGEREDGSPFHARGRATLVVAPDLHRLTVEDKSAAGWVPLEAHPLALRAVDRSRRPVADTELAVVIVQDEAVAEPTQGGVPFAPRVPTLAFPPVAASAELRVHLLDPRPGWNGMPAPAWTPPIPGCAGGGHGLLRPPPPSPQSALSYRQRLAALGPQPLAAFAQVVTDADGRATVPVTLPYAGRWRVRVVAAGPNPSQVGRSEWTIETVGATPPP